MTAIGHMTVPVEGGQLHVAHAGAGPPLVLLHGWPEFWLTWEPVMQRLAGQYHVIAPDLRGFGASHKPAGPFGPADHARDMVALLDHLGVSEAGVVGHDVGGAVMQSLARAAPNRLTGLFFFGFVYPGIGARMLAPERLTESWYTAFQSLDLAPALLRSSPEAVRVYFTHFLRHWSHKPDAFDDVLERFVENFQQPGNIEGGFAHYRAALAGRIAMTRGEAPILPAIDLPTCVRWPEHDVIFPYSWTDRLHETFSSLDLAPFPGVGHFPHREDPDRAAAEIAAFFGRI